MTSNAGTVGEPETPSSTPLAAVSADASVRILTALAVFALCLVVYSTHFSQQLAWDGPLEDVTAVTRGGTTPHSRHVLYTFLGVPYYRLWQSLGYGGDASLPLLVVNAVAGALTVVMVYALLLWSTRRTALAAALALLYAFSYGFWYYVEDAFYNVSSQALLLVVVLMLAGTLRTSGRSPRTAQLLVVSLAMAVTLVGSLQHAPFAVVAVVALLVLPLGTSLAERARSAVLFASATGGLTALAFLVLARIAAGCTSAACLRSWLDPYGGALPPMYMQWSGERVVSLGMSFVSAVVPLNRGLRLRRLVDGVVQPDRVAGQLALLLLGISLIWLALQAWRHRRGIWQRHAGPVTMAGLWLAVYLPVVTWFDPFGAELWIVPLVAVLLIVAAVSDLAMDRARAEHGAPIRVVGMATIAAIGLANYQLAIRPDHVEPNHDRLKARAFVAMAGEADLIVSPALDWTRYVESEGGSTLNLIWLSTAVSGREPNGERLLKELELTVRDVRARGGRALIVDVTRYDERGWRWIHENTGLTRTHLLPLIAAPAFELEGEPLRELRIDVSSVGAADNTAQGISALGDRCLVDNPKVCDVEVWLPSIAGDGRQPVQAPETVWAAA